MVIEMGHRDTESTEEYSSKWDQQEMYLGERKKRKLGEQVGENFTPKT